MQKWKYMVIEIEYGVASKFIILGPNDEHVDQFFKDRFSIIKLINDFGKKGWEIINLTKDLTCRNCISLLLKCPIEE